MCMYIYTCIQTVLTLAGEPIVQVNTGAYSDYMEGSCLSSLPQAWTAPSKPSSCPSEKAQLLSPAQCIQIVAWLPHFHGNQATDVSKLGHTSRKI